MQFHPIRGSVRTVECISCHREITCGSEPYKSASTGLELYPDRAYRTIYDQQGIYCEPCAVKHVEAIDTTLARTAYYADTRGTRVL